MNSRCTSHAQSTPVSLKFPRLFRRSKKHVNPDKSAPEDPPPPPYDPNAIVHHYVDVPIDTELKMQQVHGKLILLHRREVDKYCTQQSFTQLDEDRLFHIAMAQFIAWNSSPGKEWKHSRWKLYAVMGITADQGWAKRLDGRYVYSSKLIKRLCRAQLLQYHPDKSDSADDLAISKMLTTANAILCDEEKRSNYNVHGDKVNSYDSAFYCRYSSPYSQECRALFV